MNRDVFISYSRKNYDAVIEIKRQIDAATGTECWIDLKGIESGSDLFIKDIIGGIDNCKVFLFMLSKESQQSEYALLELNYAKTKNKRVVLVNIDDCNMEGVFLFKYGLADTIAWNNQLQHDKLIRDLFKWIGTTIHQEQKPTTAESELTPISTPQEHTMQPETQDQLQQLEQHLAKLDKEIGELSPFTDSSHKYGFIDKTGKIVIPCEWEEAYNFSEGLSSVMDSNSKWGFIDKTGKLVIPCEWENAEGFSEGLASVRDSNNKYGFIDKTGKIVIPCEWGDAGCFSEGLGSVRDANNKYGFIDKTGKIVIPCEWKYGVHFSEGLAQVRDANNKYGFIDKTGKLVIHCEWENVWWFSEGLASVRDSNNKHGFIDKTGKLVIPCEWDDASIFFNNGVAKVKGKVGVLGRNKWHTIDKTGKLIS